MRGAGKGSGQTGGQENVSAKSSPLRIGKLIGSGGEGSVYEHRDDPRMVIKVLHQQYATPERAAKLSKIRIYEPG